MKFFLKPRIYFLKKGKYEFFEAEFWLIQSEYFRETIYNQHTDRQLKRWKQAMEMFFSRELANTFLNRWADVSFSSAAREIAHFER